MQIKVELDEGCKEPEIIIRTDKLTDAIQNAIQLLSSPPQKRIAGYSGDSIQLLDADSILRFYAYSQKVFAQTESQEFAVRLRLYELEERLDSTQFIRISNSEIVNLKAIQKIDLSFAGAICMSLTNGDMAYVSRRYVSKIKHVLGI